MTLMDRSRRVVDLSHPLDEGTPPYPGDPAVKMTVFDQTDGAPEGEIHANASGIATSLHCGTHIDAPFHFCGDGKRIDQVDLAQSLGPATRVRLPYAESPVIGREHLASVETSLRQTRRLIFHTGWFERWKHDDYFTGHPMISTDAAEFLVECGTVLIGVDFPSPDRHPYATHLVLLGAGILIVENQTNIDALPGDTFEFFAVPLKISGRDGSPVRAFAIEH